MLDTISEERLAQVHPLLATKIRTMATMLEQENIVFRVTQGLRTWSEQDALWQKGRDADGNVADRAMVVTNAKGGSSWHNFGLAVDVVPSDDSLGAFQADWNVAHPAWKRLVSVGTSLGLAAGADWRTFPDWPHFQLTGRFPASPDDEVRWIFKEAGIAGVWDEAFKSVSNA